MQYFRKKSELNYKYLYVYCLIKGHKGANQNKTVILFNTQEHCLSITTFPEFNILSIIKFIN